MCDVGNTKYYSVSLQKNIMCDVGNTKDYKTGIKWSEYTLYELKKRREELVKLNIDCYRSPAWLTEIITYINKF